MKLEDLTDQERETMNELDGISLRMFGPLTYAQLDHDQAAEVVWQSLRELCGTFDPPFDPGGRPAGWSIDRTPETENPR